MAVNRKSEWMKISIVVLMLGRGLGVSAYGFAGGTGEPNDPYQIATADDLLSIGSDRELLDKHFTLISDIDLDPNLPGGRVFEDALIARDQSDGVSSHAGDAFSGVLDGRGHTIRNLRISGKYGYDVGLFGKLSGLVQDLHLRNVQISGSPCGALAGLSARGVILRCTVSGQVSGSEDIGGMVGDLWEGALLDCRCEIQATGGQCVGGLVGGGPGGTLIRCEWRGDIRGDLCAGGLVGELRHGQIVDSRAKGTVTGIDEMGGLVGSMPMAASIIRCTADCDVTAEQNAGGLAGTAAFFGPYGQLILDCYARGSVAGSVAGGLMGSSADVRIVNSYAACAMIPVTAPEATSAALGGFFGTADVHWPPQTAGCFWDAELSVVSVSAGAGPVYFGTGLATKPMQQEDTFARAGWDFRSTWTVSEGDYPVLQWESARDEVEKANAAGEPADQ
jgi:hypothetical protein